MLGLAVPVVLDSWRLGDDRWWDKVADVGGLAEDPHSRALRRLITT